MNIQFEGIDDFNRPIFKGIDSNQRFGSVDFLFGYESTEKEVLDVISEEDLLYFGNTFECEPMGSAAPEINIVRKNK